MKTRLTTFPRITARLLMAVLMTAGMFTIPASAHAAATITGGPYTGLNPSGATITLTITNPPTNGMYIQQCQITQGTRPSATQCNTPAQLWITNSGQGNFRFTDTITINVRESFGSISCNTVGCGLFFRLDHTASPTNTSEDRFIPIQFTGGTSIVLPDDEITVKVGTVELVAQRPAELTYRTPITLTATARSGSALTARSLGANCTVDSTFVVTALKGSGECVIAVTSAGNSSYGSNTANFPFILRPSTQALDLTIPSTTKLNKAIVLAPATLTTSMGERIKVSAKPASACTITVAKKAYTLKAKKPGSCVITVTAPGRTDLYAAFKTTATVTVTR